MTIERYHTWKDENKEEFIPVSIEGEELINNRILNKGTSFSLREREELGLIGLLPDHVTTMEEQLLRVYEGFCECSSPLDKYIFVRSLQNRNATLFYALVYRHLEEMVPIIYTPTVGEACQKYSHLFHRARGLYITPNNVERMHEMMEHFPSHNIQMIVATDNEGILGIGDQGVGGMGIPVGKLSLYVLGAGIHPASGLPITLDVGTNNQSLLDDPCYLGLRQKRLRGEEYRLFIKKFVDGVKKFLPGAVLQWEDFSKQNAFTNLDTYREELPSFNDDIQGTGAVALAGILGALKKVKGELKEQKFAIYGAGAGGVGIARQIHAGLVSRGLEPQEAFDRIFILDSKGVVFDDVETVEEYKRAFAKKRQVAEGWRSVVPGHVSLSELLENEKISVLIGTSGQAGAFNEAIVREMCENTEHPIIFPLSNPTSKCETSPAEVYRISKGKAVVATGSPFDDVQYDGKTYRIGQGNNAFIFPGVGLAAIVGKVSMLSNEMFTRAAYALADFVSEEELQRGTVYPRIDQLREVSIVIAKAILNDFIENGTVTHLKKEDISSEIEKAVWNPKYLPYRRV